DGKGGVSRPRKVERDNDRERPRSESAGGSRPHHEPSIVPGRTASGIREGSDPRHAIIRTEPRRGPGSWIPSEPRALLRGQVAGVFELAALPYLPLTVGIQRVVEWELETLVVEVVLRDHPEPRGGGFEAGRFGLPTGPSVGDSNDLGQL